METKLKTFGALFLALIFSACGVACGRGNSTGQAAPSSTEGAAHQTAAQQAAARSITAPVTAGSVEDAVTRRSLDELAELERAGSWFQGMGLAESGMRENTGDYAGAVAAAYKEMAWAYGKGLIQKEDPEQGLLNILAMNNTETVTAAMAVLAFNREQWAEASASLGLLFDETEEPDGFGRWMILACALETNSGDRQAAAAYRAIRARYTHFPEYWYRGARAFSGVIAADYAERCINSAPQGPFAGECRNKLAAYTGLKNEDGLSIKTKTEIETIISQSLNTGNPQILDSLIPLISLPDNPYTIYAVGALRALTPVRQYRDYFDGQAAGSKGRLAERLSYICRG